MAHPVPPRFTDKNLYGPNGPVASDIKQDALGDCYFVATLASVARQKPLSIRNSVSYDRASHRFIVRLFNSAGKIKYIHVSQAELADNIARQGGSLMDNTGKDTRAWPAVFETAYAKLFDSDPTDGLAEGYNKIAAGGFPEDAMMAITGFVGETLRYAPIPMLNKARVLELLGSRVATALKQKKAVTVCTKPDVDIRTLLDIVLLKPMAKDGLVDDHVYTVMSMTQARSGAWTLNLRNPWGTNVGVGEGPNKNAKSALISVSLQTLVDTGGLDWFNISNERIR
jgi:hypothetical protein